MSRASSRRRALTAVICLLAAAFLVRPSMARACKVSDFDCSDQRVRVVDNGVIGRAVVISDGHGGVRTVAGGGCAGCVWRITRDCPFHTYSVNGTTDPAACGNSASGYSGYVCQTPGGQTGTPYVSLFSRSGPAGPWTLAGKICVGPQEKPVSVDALLGQARAYADRLIAGRPRVTMQPGGVTIVNLPTLFQSGQATTPAGQVASALNRPTSRMFFAAAGTPVTLQVTVTPQKWAWRVDGGSTVFATDFPGRPYDPSHSPQVDPAYYAAHTFTHTGAHSISVTESWSASVFVRGLGALSLDGVVQRTSAPQRFVAKEARAQLIYGA